MTQFNAPSYDIQRPTGQCAITGRTLEPGDAYVATLVECDPDAPPTDDASDTQQQAAQALGLQRVDVSLEAWQQGKRPERLFGFWRTTVAHPEQKKQLFVNDDLLMNLFVRLEEADEPQRLAFRFVLGLILMRKRLLRYDGTEHRTGPDGQLQDWWLMTPRGAAAAAVGMTGEPQAIAVLDPHLGEQDVQHVTEQLGQILEAEL